MKQTAHLGLNLIDGTDIFMPNILNQNFSKIDENSLLFANSIQELQIAPTESAFQKLMLGKVVSPYMSMEVFTKSGTFDPVKYNLKIGQLIQVLAVGGGGGGADSTLAYPANTTQHKGDSNVQLFSATGGGGGSGFLELFSMKLTSLTKITVTIGNGGSKGTDGAPTKFGSYLTAAGGKKGANPTITTQTVPNSTNSIRTFKPGVGGNGYCNGASGTVGVFNTGGGSASDLTIANGGCGYVIGQQIHPSSLQPISSKLLGVEDLRLAFGSGGDSGVYCMSNIEILPDNCYGKPGGSGILIVTW